MYDWLIFIHVLSGFLVVAGLACVTPLVLGAAVDEAVSSKLVIFSRALFGLGGLGTLIFGLWLVVNQDYKFFKLWVLGALLLWLVAAGTGNYVSGPAQRNLYWAAVASTVAILVLMVFKPGV